MKTSKKGYKKNSPDKNEESLLIPSNRITMKDVPHPVYGVDDTGFAQMMYPEEEYVFPGSHVYEFPIMQSGGTYKGYEDRYNVYDENNIDDGVYTNPKQMRKVSSALAPVVQPFNGKQILNTPEYGNQSLINRVNADPLTKVKMVNHNAEQQQGRLGNVVAPLVTNALANLFIENRQGKEIDEYNRIAKLIPTEPVAQNYRGNQYETDYYMQEGGMYGNEMFSMTDLIPTSFVELGKPSLKNTMSATPIPNQETESVIEETSSVSDEVETYLKHQQGKAGIKLIKKAAEQGLKEIPRSWNKENINKNMKNNVYEDFDGEVTPAKFLAYWQNKYNKYKQVALSTPTKYDNIFEQVGKEQGINPSVLKTVAYIESRFNPDAKGKTGTYKGLFQIGTSLQKDYKLKNVFDPYENTVAGAKSLKRKHGGEYQEGGEYNLSDKEIQDLISQGYEIEYLD